MALRSLFTAPSLLALMCLAGCGDSSVSSKSSDNSMSNDRSYRSEPPPASVASNSEMHIQTGAGSEARFPATFEHEQVTSESYDRLPENGLNVVNDQPLSTFSIDVDTASYANVRRFLRQRQLPPPEAVRVEEMINYFTYNDPPADGDVPFSVNVEIAGCPWNKVNRLARIGLKAKSIASRERPACNIVFLIDVSGSMNHPKKLPLVKDSIRLLVEQLGESDHLGIVVYAGAAGLVLPPTSAVNKDRIQSAINRLQPGGSTNGALGIGLAYDIARENFLKEGVNRVVLCTDGDFNVGVTNPNDLQKLIETQAKSGVYLTVLGFGMGNLKDSTMERLADHGNGNYGYIDGIAEARKLLVDQLSGTLVTVAKDVKIQVEFNPAKVAAYRLVGYENRRLANRDFHDDSKDAGEIGAGHSVTALYELVPVGAAAVVDRTDNQRRYQPVRPNDAQQNAIVEGAPVIDEMFAVKLRYKEPSAVESRLLQVAVVDRGIECKAASTDFQFAAAVAQFGMLLKNSRFRGDGTFEQVIEMAARGVAEDPKGYRTEFLELVAIARQLTHDESLLSRRE